MKSVFTMFLLLLHGVSFHCLANFVELRCLCDSVTQSYKPLSVGWEMDM